MHSYSLDAPERKIIPLFLTVFAILAAWFLNVVLVGLHFTVPWWVDAPSVMGFYALFYEFFDSYLWRWSFLRSIRLVKTPVLSGLWTGTCTSSFDQHTEEVKVELRIRQTWTNIQISLFTAKSKSHSLVAAISVDAVMGSTLSYQYQNDPRSNSPESMQIHYGTTTLSIGEDTLDGEYYSGRGRQNIGTLSLSRMKFD